MAQNDLYLIVKGNNMNEFETPKKGSEKKHRFFKLVKITYSDIKNDTAENVLNDTLNIIYENGGDFVSSSCVTIGVGVTSPVFLVYNITYEAVHVIPEIAFKKVRNIWLT